MSSIAAPAPQPRLVRTRRTAGRPDAAEPGPTQATYLRRRTVAVAVLMVLVTLLALAIGRIGAQAELADPVAGHVVLEPGETLWDVAVSTAPDDVDPRAQLHALRELNDLHGDTVAAWTVILVPAR